MDRIGRRGSVEICAYVCGPKAVVRKKGQVLVERKIQSGDSLPLKSRACAAQNSRAGDALIVVHVTAATAAADRYAPAIAKIPVIDDIEQGRTWRCAA